MWKYPNSETADAYRVGATVSHILEGPLENVDRIMLSQSSQLFLDDPRVSEWLNDHRSSRDETQIVHDQR